MTKPKVLVTFKDEGEEMGVAIGPVVVIDVEGLNADGGAVEEWGVRTVGRPFGSLPPLYEDHLGWKSKPEAMRIARERGAEFREV